MGELQQSRAKRRKTKRYTVSTKVARYDGESAFWRSVNLGESGCFVTDGPLLEIGTIIEIALWLESDQASEEVVVQARVVWINSERNTHTPMLPVGMGLQFIDIDEQGRAALRLYLASASNPGPTPTLALKRPDAALPTHEPGRDKLEPGAMLGVYRILELLGEGGMGTVYLAEHQSLGRKVAIKTLHSRFAHDTTIVRRFFDEARAVNQIDHENIVEITDFVHGSENFFVMEHLKGQTLAQLQTKDQRLPLDRVLRIMQQLASALAAAHAVGIIHRDLKPENVLLVERNANPDFVKLLDFGIAKVATAGVSMNQTATGMLVGTPGFIAPEQILNGKTDHRSDIYAFGVLLYLMVTGKKPFVADTWPQLLVKHTTELPPLPKIEGSHLPQALVTLVMRCLEKNPDERPASMDEIRAELTRLSTGETPPPPLPAYAEEDEAPNEARRAGVSVTLVLGSIAALALLTAGGLVFLHASAATTPVQAIATNASAEVPQAASTAAEEEAVIGEPEEQKPAPRAPKEAPPSARAPKKKSADAAPAAEAQAGSVAFQLDILAQLLKQRDYAQAEQVGEALLKIAPRHPMVHRTLGIVYSSLAKKTEACRSFRQYLALSPQASDRGRVESLLVGCP